ncbi:MAG: hypothetical protein JW825_06460 [Candidatus Methanofastidiosa archaeon]|nr:hypothetical protein [Candidatus Methanofastidiosa archaeon]
MNKKLSLLALSIISIAMISMAAAEVFVTNGYYTLFVDDDSDYGAFTVGTGTLHPYPTTNVLFGGEWADAGTSWFAMKFYSSGGNEYYLWDLYPYYQGAATDTNAINVSWELGEDFFNDEVPSDQGSDSQIPNPFIISRTFTIYGDTYETSYIEIETTFTNNSTSAISFGFLDMWDLMIADADDAIMRTIYPTLPWTGSFQGWYPPTFLALEVTDTKPPNNQFSIYIPFIGDIFTPTVPDEFIYGAWASVGMWGYVPFGGNDDSGVAFIYGATEEEQITLAPDESIQIYQYISTNAESFDIVVPSSNNVTPASFIPLYRVKLQQALEMWECILSQLPEDITEENVLLIDSVQTFMNGAITLTNPIYANGQLSKAIDQMTQIQEAFDIHCIED